MSRVASVLLCCASVAFMPASITRAQSNDSEYQDQVQKGLHEYELGNFSEAKAFFLRAHALSPNARTLRGLGMSSYELRNYVEAIDYFQKALTTSERALTEQMRTEVAQLLSQARSFVTRLELTVQPKDAQVHLDTHDVSRDTDGNVLMDPGSHQLVVDAPDYESITRTIRSDGSEMLQLNITLRSSHKAPAQVAPQRAVPLVAQKKAAADSSGSAGPWIVMGASSAVAAAGGVLLALALGNKHDVESAKAGGDDGPRYADYRDKERSVLPLSAAGIAGLSLGLAGITAGVVWAAKGGESDERPSASVSISAGGAMVRATF